MCTIARTHKQLCSLPMESFFPKLHVVLNFFFTISGLSVSCLYKAVSVTAGPCKSAGLNPSPGNGLAFLGTCWSAQVNFQHAGSPKCWRSVCTVFLERLVNILKHANRSFARLFCVTTANCVSLTFMKPDCEMRIKKKEGLLCLRFNWTYLLTVSVFLKLPVLFCSS